MFTNKSTNIPKRYTHKAEKPMDTVIHCSIINSMTNLDVNKSEYVEICVHREVISKVIKNRELTNKYKTCKELKTISLYYLLKSISQTSIIQNYASGLHDICEYSGVSLGTFYTQLNKLISLGLVKKQSNNLVLAPYRDLLELYDISEAIKIKINYTPQKQKFSHLLEFAPLADNMYRQSVVIKRKFEKSPYTLELLQRYAKQQTTAKTLSVAQKQAFVNGSEELGTLFFINPTITITWKRLFREFNFKSYKSVSYLKKKLQRNKIVTIEKNGFFTSKVGAKTKAYNEEKEKDMVTCRYNKTINKTQKQFADNWNLTSNIYAFTPYYKN